MGALLSSWGWRRKVQLNAEMRWLRMNCCVIYFPLSDFVVVNVFEQAEQGVVLSSVPLVSHQTDLPALLYC